MRNSGEGDKSWLTEAEEREKSFLRYAENCNFSIFSSLCGKQTDFRQIASTLLRAANLAMNTCGQH
jgi:hypothetical protein